MRKRTRLALVAGLCLLGAMWWGVSRVTLSALDPPGRLESWAASRTRRWLIGRAARGLAITIPDDERALAAGEMRFRGECAPCHGNDGRSLSDIGRGMYPRAVDLGSPAVQSWSDAELFWIIKHGVRLTGMPGFGRALDDDEIRSLVAHVRTLSRPSGSGEQPPES
jgi:mono/diheme cytochrome c family protein